MGNVNGNGYFQIIRTAESSHLRIYAPTEGYMRADVKEISDYLDRINIKKYKLSELKTAVEQEIDHVDVILEDILPFPVDEKLKVRISGDDMLVWCRFYPPSNDGKLLDKQGIVDELKQYGVVYGVDFDKVEEFLACRQYALDYMIAKGTLAVPGKDASIRYMFQTDLTLKPKHNENGTVDYRNINTITKVEKGDLLARLEKEVPGIVGCTVKGNKISPKEAKKAKLSYSNNISINDDKTEIYADVTGHASLVGDKVFVSGVYEVPADVDLSTGNITFPGNVLVKGNVKSGFTIRADGDIVVEGVVEGAELYAKGQIIVKRGIHGMNKGILSSEKNVIIKFVESATINSGGYVETESIMQSKVDAKTEIRVAGNKGFIVGGVLRAGSSIEAKTIGSEMGNLTQIEVGADPEMIQQFHVLQEELKELNKNIVSIKPIVTNYLKKMADGDKLDTAKVVYVKKLAQEMKILQLRQEEKTTEFLKINTFLRNSEQSYIKVNNVIFPGVEIKISDLKLKLEEEKKYCKFFKRDGEIKQVSL